MNISNAVSTLATEDELQDLALLCLVGCVADDLLSITDSEAMYNTIVSIESEEHRINAVCDVRADKIIELCLTGK